MVGTFCQLKLQIGYRPFEVRSAGLILAVSRNAKNDDDGVVGIEVRWLLQSPMVKLHDTNCRGRCRHQSAEEHTKTTQLVFPYRGVYVRHLGGDPTVAEANQVLFFNAMEGYTVSHPVEGGDASLTLILDPSQLLELAPRDLLRNGPEAGVPSEAPRYRRTHAGVGGAAAIQSARRHGRTARSRKSRIDASASGRSGRGPRRSQEQVTVERRWSTG